MTRTQIETHIKLLQSSKSRNKIIVKNLINDYQRKLVKIKKLESKKPFTGDVILKPVDMKTSILKNDELGLNLNYWNGKNKNERVFLAQQIMKQLGYKGGNQTLRNHELEEGVDKITLNKKKSPKFFEKLTSLNLVGARASATIMLYESGVQKLLLNSNKDNIEYIYKTIFRKSVPLVLNRYIENHYFELIVDSFKGVLNIDRQFSIKGYNVDGYIKELNIVLECDEKGHTHYDKTKDAKRTETINKELNSPTFIRFNPDTTKASKIINLILKTLLKDE